MPTAEEVRLDQSRRRTHHWKRWGPYLSERAWGTVREDYSSNGTAWEFFPHEHARSRAYRWNEDGLAGVSDRHGRLCIGLALWNGQDRMLKERLFGLTGNEGNHAEDVKECYYYLDSTPTHSYMRCLYKYPQRAFPYEDLLATNRARTKTESEYELRDTGIFDDSRYFDVFVEYAKDTPEIMYGRVTAINRGPEPAVLHILPNVWFRNTWSWSRREPRPTLRRCPRSAAGVEMDAPLSGRRWVYFAESPEMLYTENDTNVKRVFGLDTGPGFFKDAFHDYVIEGRREAVNGKGYGTKAAAHYVFNLQPGESARVEWCLSDGIPDMALAEVALQSRKREADEFYATVTPSGLSDDGRNVMRQAFGGLMWTKQFYHYVVRDWLDGDESQPTPPEQRKHGRNSEWTHLFNADVISMPDKWEYPWYAAWDLAFHCLPIALIDSEFAKEQLMLMCREWYMHPNGQLPAYEWALSDVNPPVHAWAAWRVYKIEKKRTGKGDRTFLQRIFHKLLLNFTWWVNRKDARGRNIFQGGFLGLDNIGVFNRSDALPTGGHIEQADGTGWMAMYCLNMLAIAMELAREDDAYEDVASKFWEHFLYIAYAINNLGDDGDGMWNEKDGFFYDVLHMPDGRQMPLSVRSIVGLIPLFAVETLESDVVEKLSGFKRRMDWFLANRPDLTANVASMRSRGDAQRRLLALVNGQQLRRVLSFMLDEKEFLSPHGIRALSRHHRDHPYVWHVNGSEYRVEYEPAESTTGLFGGNSNWRGPVWFPVNYLMIESLQRFHHYYGDDFTVEFPTGSGNKMTLWDIAAELSRRLTRLFLRDESGRRPAHGDDELHQTDPHWRDLILFYEYFHGDDGSGVGAEHQTGWTGLVAKLLQQSGE